MSQHTIHNPELFTEITRNLDLLNKNDKMKNILRPTKIIKNKRKT